MSMAKAPALYIAEYGETASGEECSIIIAFNIEEAQQLAIEVINKSKAEVAKVFGQNTETNIVFVNTKPRTYAECNYREKECRVREIPIEKGIVYTGYYCC